ncbi:CHAT domain-containing tetratricopeptide repeat protein [Aquimarina sp. Aq107]|uniref:CHAT domain-containing protein n=1 Tax=Aquimarina sp. Aq107 TaxID=1191912 RepID=UPI000D552320|nr:CHAT domain-containing tetratricopeptide repeat protein [Aquimarina sp. Aq107]
MYKKKIVFILYIIFFLTLPTKGQGISPELDSIHQLTGSNFNKLELYYGLIKTHERSENYTQLGYDAHQIAKWIHKEKKWEEAIKIVEIAYQAREKATPFNKELLKRSYYNYAIYNRRHENYTIAIEYFEKLLALGGTKFLRGKSYELIGESYEILGDYYKSVDYRIKSLQNYSKKDIQKGFLVYGNINLAYSYRLIRSAESSKKAIEHLLKAEKLLGDSSTMDKQKLYNIKNNLGNLYCEGVGTQNIDNCIKCYDEALTILKELEFKEKYAKSYYNLGLTFIEIDSIRSQFFFDKALEYASYAPSFKHKIFFGLGIKELSNENYIAAQENFSSVFSIYFDKKIKDIYWLPAKNDLEQVVNKTFFLELLKRKLKAWIELGKTKNDSLYFEEAIRTAHASDQLVDLLLKENISTRSKLLWRSLASEIYIMGLEACLQLKKNEDSYYFMEKSKALLLLQEITKDKTALSPSILEKEKKLKDVIVGLRSKLRLLDQNSSDSIQKVLLSKQARLKKIRDSLAPIYPTYFTHFSIPEITPLSKLELSPNEVIIEYNMAERIAGVIPEAYGMFITKNKKEIFKIENVNRLQKEIYRLRELLNKPFTTSLDISEYSELAYSLYNSLIPKNLQKHLVNNKVTFIPDYILNYIPFEALITNPKKGTYLIQQTEINYAYSLSFSKENAKIDRKPKNDYLGIAPITFSNILTSLPNSKKELVNAKHYYSGDLLLNEKATIQNFKKVANQYKILHLATHADASDSLTPWIAFQREKLTELQLSTIDNQSELVVLSACNTSLGKINTGEGVFSLARGFFKSGANTVIPTLWNTNDKATATITSDFYKNLSKGQTKSAALRTAKLNYLNNNTDAEASPHYWASLVLIGDSGTLLPQSNNLLFLWIGLGIILLVLVIYRFYLIKKK